MANGFKALRNVGGGCQRLSEYSMADDAADMFNGDLVKLVAGELAPADPADTNTGTFLGCMFVNAQGEQKFSPYWTASAGATEISAVVSGDVNVSYKVETNVALVPGSAALMVVGTGDPKTGSSAQSAIAGAGNLTVKKNLEPEMDYGTGLDTFYAEVTFNTNIGVA